MCTRKTRVLDVVYNASNNELVRTKTLVKGCIVVVDATPFRQWYEAHYGVELNKKKGGKLDAAVKDATGKSAHVAAKLAARQKERKLDDAVGEGLATGRLYASVSSRPGQCGRVDGYILEGQELQFYMKKLASKKSKKQT